MTSKIINNQFNQLENSKSFKDIEQKCKRAEWSRKYYVNNREKIIKQKMEYNKHYEKHNENSNLYTRVKYYCKKGYFENVDRNEAIEITNYLINNNLSIKYIPFVKEYLELSKIKIT